MRQTVYIGFYGSKDYAEVKIGQTSNICNRYSQLKYKECIEVQKWHTLPEEYDSLSYGLFIESYLRMKLAQYAKHHPKINMRQVKTDFFAYNPRYRGIMPPNFTMLFDRWYNEALSILLS